MLDQYKATVFGAANILRSHPVGQLPHISRLWDTVAWQTYKEQEIKAHAEVNCEGKDEIRLYPSLVNHPHADWVVLREFGLLILGKTGDQGKDLWRNKLAQASQEAVDSFQLKLKDPTRRAQFQSYADVVQSFASAVDRYTALNLANALQANNVPFSDSTGVDITTWGATAEYARGKRFHSLVPLTSVYMAREQNESFGVAFADLLVEDLASVREKSVAKAVRGLIERIVRTAA